MLKAKRINTFDILKFFAIIFVIFAHACGVENPSNHFEEILAKFANLIGTMGVPIFLVSSGFFICYNKDDLSTFMYKKILYTIIPWLFSGTLVFFYVYLRKPSFNIQDYLNFIIGNGSYLYFLPIYLILSLVGFFLKNRDVTFLTTIFFISLISCFSFQLMDYIGNLLEPVVSPYLNPIIFIPFFLFGMIWNKKIFVFEKVFNNKIVLFIGFILFITIVILTMFNIIKISYFSPFFLLFVTGYLPLLIFLSKLIKPNSIIMFAGQKTFAIYLYHMPVAGICSHFFNVIPFWHFVLLRPFFVFAIVLAFIFLINKLFAKTKISKFVKIIGF